MNDWQAWQQTLLELIAQPEYDASANLALPAAALAVYRNNYRVGLSSTLAFIYPVCRQLVGDEFFNALADAFIEQHPSRSGNLHHYGQELAHWLAGFAPAQSLPYLPDLAGLEWAVHRAYYAANFTPLDSAALAKVPPESWPNLTLQLAPTLTLLRSDWPIGTLWLAHQNANPDAALQQIEAVAENVVVTRRDGQVTVQCISRAQATLIDSLAAGQTLDGATQQALALDPKLDLQSSLLLLFQQHGLSGFRLADQPGQD